MPKIRMPDGTIIERNISTESPATFMERAKAGLAPEKTRVKAWEGMLGAGNVKQTPDGDILIRKGGQWGPVEGENWTPSEILGDIADYSGELVEDIGAGTGAALGAVKGTAVLPGIGTVAGISAGGSAGRALGNVARQGLAEMAGVQGYDGERLPEIGMSALEGAIVEPIGFGVGKGIAAGAKMAAPVIKDAAAKAGRGLTQMMTGVSEKGTKALYDNPKLIREISKDPITFADKTVNNLRGKVVSAKKDAGSKLEELTNEIFTRQDPINNLATIQRIDDVLAKRNITFDADGKAIVDYADIQNDAEIAKLLDLRNKIAKAPSVFDVRALRKGLDDIVYINGQDVSSLFKRARTDIRNAIEDSIEEAALAKGPDVGDAYKALKKDYQKAATNYDFVDDIFEIPQPGTKASKVIAEETRGSRRIRNLQGDANAKYWDGLQQFAADNPDLAPEIEGILNVGAGTEWGQFIPANKMDIGRGAMGLVAGAATRAPVESMIGYAATRPKVAQYYLPAVGEAIQAPIGAIGGLATPIGEQVSREAVRVGSELPVIGERTGLSEREIESAIIENAPSIVDYAKSRYGANFKRATDQGADESTAAFMVVADQLRKGNKNVIGAFGDMATDSGMGDDRFGNTVANILDRYTGIQ